LIAGALMVFAFAFSSSESEQVEKEAGLQDAREETAAAPRPMVLFQPMAWTTEAKQVPVDEIVAQIENELRRKRANALMHARVQRDQAGRPD
jgi:hypothetical protein